jgi:N-acetylmuramic acid 6-phosphate etherase
MAIFKEQLAAAAAVESQVEALACAADEAANRLENPAGRLVCVGAGTSGRLAILDATELRPTFGWSDDRLIYGIAGGIAALSGSVENAEDDEDSACELVRSAKLGAHDVMIGVSASGTTPFTVTAIREASTAGALTVALANNADSPLLQAAKHAIFLDTGAEPLAGSTRMKAGTAQKIALNILSTAIMVRLGRVYDGLMVDMRVSNRKLRARAIDIVSQISGVGASEAEAALDVSQENIKLATLVAMGLNTDDAARLLQASSGNLRGAMTRLRRERPSTS